jgi:hypothetical protein
MKTNEKIGGGTISNKHYATCKPQLVRI